MQSSLNAKEKDHKDRCGKFIFNNQSGEKGQPATGDFIFVPEAFDFTTRDGMKKILQALNIEAPSFAFRFDANYGLAPNTKSARAWTIGTTACSSTTRLKQMNQEILKKESQRVVGE